MSLKQIAQSVYQIEHPLLLDKVSRLRDINSDYAEFRKLLHQITLLMLFEATQNMATKKVVIETPLEKHETAILLHEDPVVVPVLRAGMGMVDAFLELIPKARVGFIGLHRNHITHHAEHYFHNIPEIAKQKPVFVCDPTFATGGSAIESVNLLKREGITDITFLAVISAPEGITKFAETHPDVRVYTAAVDRELNANAYILPGVGDAGDRVWGS